jgi:hypothetical protein
MKFRPFDWSLTSATFQIAALAKGGERSPRQRSRLGVVKAPFRRSLVGGKPSWRLNGIKKL